MLSALASALHLLGLAVGSAASLARILFLKQPLDGARVKAVLAADNWAGLAALLWVGTGLWRLFGGLEKGTAFYFASRLFWLKMALFAVAWALEMKPMLTFIRWRMRMQKGEAPDTAGAEAMRPLMIAQLVVLAAMVFTASFMARGYGFVSSSP